MIDDCETENIDMIITKSISRFARNTLDCLKYIRQLKDKNIPVFFEKEAINTMDAKGEVLITIMAFLAQQESNPSAQNVKLGLQFSLPEWPGTGKSQSLPRLHQDADGNLIIRNRQKVVKPSTGNTWRADSMDRIAKVWKQTAFSPALAKQNGGPAPSAKSSETEIHRRGPGESAGSSESPSGRTTSLWSLSLN